MIRNFLSGTSLVAALSAVLLLSGCQTTQPNAAPAMADMSTDAWAAPIDAASATLTVYGMSCPKCATNIDRQLMDVEGVTSVKTGLREGHVVVAFAPDRRPSRAALADAITESGFTLVRIDVP